MYEMYDAVAVFAWLRPDGGLSDDWVRPVGDIRLAERILHNKPSHLQSAISHNNQTETLWTLGKVEKK